jgi:tRNA (guanine37-N1)-methyltransferase
MSVRCVRVARENGEAIRQLLAEADALSEEHEIEVSSGEIHLPLDPATDSATIDSILASGRDIDPEIDVIEREPPRRDSQSIPADMLDFEPSYERLGEIVIIDEDDDDRAQVIAEAVLESDLPAKTVVNRASPIEGELRIRQWDVVGGNGTETVHREHGCAFELDIAEVYFSPRLATERHRVVEMIKPDERVFDMFAGVGPFVIPAAKRGAECVGVDLNETAINYLRRNAERNGVADRVTAIHDDVREVAGYAEWADRIVMNLPHSADEFLDTAISLAGQECLLHYYDIQPESDPFGPGERAIREAAEPTYDVGIETRHGVRSYAPHELNVCLDARLRRR